LEEKYDFVVFDDGSTEKNTHTEVEGIFSRIICDKSFCKEHSNHIFIFDSEKKASRYSKAWYSDVIVDSHFP
jgi:hypothetical protein